MKIKNLEEALICFKENAIIHGECTQNGDNKRKRLCVYTLPFIVKVLTFAP